MSKRKTIIIALLFAILVGLVTLNVRLNKNPSEPTTTFTTQPVSYMTTAAGTTEKSDLFNTVIFLGTDFTIGTKAKQSFTDVLQENNFIHSAVFAKKGITMVEDKDDDNYISLLKTIPTEHAAPTLLMFEISYFDAKGKSKIGEISTSYNYEDFDTKTVIGAMEYIVSYSQKTWCCPVAIYTCYNNDSEEYARLVDAAYEVQKKWGTDVLDLYYPMDVRISNQNKELYLKDKLNPTTKGYKDFFAPLFKKYLIEKLPQG